MKWHVHWGPCVSASSSRVAAAGTLERAAACCNTDATDVASTLAVPAPAPAALPSPLLVLAGACELLAPADSSAAAEGPQIPPLLALPLEARSRFARRRRRLPVTLTHSPPPLPASASRAPTAVVADTDVAADASAALPPSRGGLRGWASVESPALARMLRRLRPTTASPRVRASHRHAVKSSSLVLATSRRSTSECGP